MSSEADGDGKHILFLVNLCPWPGPMKPPCCMCIHFLSTHIDICLLFSPPRCPAQNAHLWLWCARAGVQFKDSSGIWRRNGDRLFNKLCLVILKERTLITPQFNTKYGDECRILLKLIQLDKCICPNKKLQNVFVQIKNCKMYVSKLKIAKCNCPN